MTATLDTAALDTAALDTVQLLDFATEMVSLHDGDGRFVTCSAASTALLGYPVAALVGRRVSDLVHPEDVAALQYALEGSPAERLDGRLCRLRRADGGWAWMHLRTRPGPYDGVMVVVMREATDLVAARQSARWAQETLWQLFDHNPNAMAMLGLDSRCERVNDALCVLLGTTADQLVGRSLGPPDETEAPAERFAVAELASGRSQQITGRQTLAVAGGPTRRVLTRRFMGRAATGRQQVILQVLAVEEAVTVRPPVPTRSQAGPPQREPRPAMPEGVAGPTSRSLLEDRLTLAVGRPERSTHFLVMFFVDLDGAARIVDRHGRATVESVLSTVGNRLRSIARGEDTVARFGDSGFVVLCPTVGTSPDIVALRRRLTRAASDAAVGCNGRKFRLAARVGASIVGPGEICDVPTLLERAEAAMDGRA